MSPRRTAAENPRLPNRFQGGQEVVGISFHLAEMRVREDGGAAGGRRRSGKSPHGEILAVERTTGTRVAPLRPPCRSAHAFLQAPSSRGGRRADFRVASGAGWRGVARRPARGEARRRADPGRRHAARRGGAPSGDVRGALTSGLAVRRRLSSAPVVTGDMAAAGIAELAARPDVLHVGYDRLVRPTGQVGTAQIGADRLLSIGVTGLGRSVGIVDSGLDLQHPDLRPPAGSAWPGVNVADGTDDLTDCSGHGTEVAGVLAGPQGIAPEAGLVVLKVFSSRDGCRTAHASDVLAAVDWAVAHAPGSDLEALNLSLADDAPQQGFCDGDDPAGAAVFASAREAGLTVVAAAGNDGQDGRASLARVPVERGVRRDGLFALERPGPVGRGRGLLGPRDGARRHPVREQHGRRARSARARRRLDDDGRGRRPDVPLLGHLRRGSGGDGRPSPRAPGAAPRGSDARDRSPPRDGHPRARHANRPRDAARRTRRRAPGLRARPGRLRGRRDPGRRARRALVRRDGLVARRQRLDTVPRARDRPPRPHAARRHAHRAERHARHRHEPRGPRGRGRARGVRSDGPVGRAALDVRGPARRGDMDARRHGRRGREAREGS